MFIRCHCIVVLCYLFLIVQEFIVKRLLVSQERLYIYSFNIKLLKDVDGFEVGLKCILH